MVNIFRQFDTLSAAQLHLLSAGSAKLLSTHELPLYGTPSMVTCVDGFVLVSVGGATMVVPAPADDD